MNIAGPAAAQRGSHIANDVSAVALQMWCTVHGFAHLLLEGQVDAPPGGGSPASRLLDIAGLLLGSLKARKGEAKTRRR